MKKRKIIEIIKNSEVLTNEEKRELIVKAKIENFINSYKLIVKTPFLLLKYLFIAFEFVFEHISILFGIITEIFNSICIKIDTSKDFTLTEGQAREKILEEIKIKNN